MSKLTDDAKNTIDGMSEEELRLEINKGRTSRFQGEKFVYLKTRFETISHQEQKIQRKEDITLKEDELSIAREANQLSKKANKRSWIAILVLIFSGIALWQSHDANRPNIQIKELPFLVWNTQSGQEKAYYGLLRVMISNSGGRAVTLNTIRKREDAGVVVGVYDNGKLQDISRSFSFYSFDESAHDQYDIFNNFEAKKKFIQLTSDEPFLGRKIDAGYTVPLYLVTRFMDDNNAGRP